MVIIDNFNAAFEQFLKHRIDSLIFEIDSTNKTIDLSQTIDNLLDQYLLTLNPHKKNEFTEAIQDFIFAYQGNIIKKIYVKAFTDGLKFESKILEE
ncbi:hypothetical protein [Metasolibacillus meyeri]|uniref:hypothetical protein n=1 Tax=Metasolibacillus meyeri TaxID=1071052 RepID=UPI000D3011ED|nr:hypothetical protein [Metasolibacillus meyeri]